MLAKAYRLVIDNQSGGAVTVAATITPWKFTAAGALEYQTQVAQAWTGGVTDATQDPADAPVDNSAVLALGAHGIVDVTVAGANYSYVYLQQSEDGGTTWADQYTNPIATVLGTGKVEFEI